MPQSWCRTGTESYAVNVMVLCLKGEGSGAMLLEACESQSESLWVTEVGFYRAEVSGAKATRKRNLVYL